MNLANCQGCGRPPSYNHCIAAHCSYDLVGSKLRCNRARCTCEIAPPLLEVAYVYGSEVIARSRQSGTTFGTSAYSNYETIGKIVAKCEAGDGVPFSMEIRYSFPPADYAFWKLYPTRPDLYPCHYARAMNIYPTRSTIASYKAKVAAYNLMGDVLTVVMWMVCAVIICILAGVMADSIVYR